MNPSKAAPKKLVAKTRAKPRATAKVPPRRQMTAALAEKFAVGPVDGPKFDSVALLRSLR